MRNDHGCSLGEVPLVGVWRAAALNDSSNKCEQHCSSCTGFSRCFSLQTTGNIQYIWDRLHYLLHFLVGIKQTTPFATRRMLNLPERNSTLFVINNNLIYLGLIYLWSTTLFTVLASWNKNHHTRCLASRHLQIPWVLQVLPEYCKIHWVTQNFALCQDGSTPYCLMLSLFGKHVKKKMA